MAAIAPARGERARTDFRGFLSVQYLRGISCAMVMAFHINQQLHGMGRDGSWFNGLAGCVDIFFVVSGFIMFASTSPRTHAPTFTARRVIRVVPLYWIVTALIVAVMVVAPRMLQSARFEPAHVLASFFFVPHPNPGTGVMDPVLVPGWTLNYEMFFYGVFALALFVSGTHRTLIASSILVGAVALGLVLRPAHDTVLGFLTADVILDFVAGMGIGALLVHRPRLPADYAKLAWALMAAGALLMAILPELIWPFGSRFLGSGIAAAMLVGGAVLLERCRPIIYLGPLRHLGDISFSLYLTHVLVLSALSQVWKKLGLAGSLPGSAGYVTVAVCACLVVGHLTYRRLEQPMERFLRARLDGRSARPARNCPA